MQLNASNKAFFRIAIVLLIFAVTLFSTCKKSSVLDCFNNTGKIEKTERPVSYFHTIRLNDNVNLHLVQSNQDKLVLEAGTNLMRKIVTEVSEDSVLTISNENSCNWVRSYNKPINVYLNVKYLRYIEYRSVGNITNTDTLRLDSLQIDIFEGAGEIKLTLRTYVCAVNLHYGTADVILNGKGVANIFYLLGAGKIDAREFEADHVYLRNWSSNDMFVWADKFLSAEIKGLGNVYYKGKPGIESSLLGEGELLPMQ